MCKILSTFLMPVLVQITAAAQLTGNLQLLALCAACQTVEGSQVIQDCEVH